MNRRRRGGYSIRDWVPPRINREEPGRILEKHAPLANFEGPGTDIMRRVKEGIKPTTNTDAAARQHDWAYYTIRSGLRKRTITIPTAKARTREADNRLIDVAKRNLNPLHPVEAGHAAAAIAGIKSKTLAEDAGLIDELKFVGKGTKDPLKKLRKQLVHNQRKE